MRSRQPSWDWGAVEREVRRLALGMSRGSSEGEDIAQNALIRLWRHHSHLRDQERQSAWIRTVVSREASRHYSKAAPELGVELDELFAEEDLAVRTAPDRIDMSRALRHLDSTDRLLVLLRYEEDLTQAAIARMLGWPEGTVKVRLHRARAKLRREYGDHDDQH